MRYLLLFILLFTSCVPTPESDNDVKHFYLRAYLECNRPVREIYVNRVKEYQDYVGPDGEIINMHEEPIRDAKVTLYHEGEPIPLMIDTLYSDRYESDHIVQEGGHYQIEVVIYDTLNEKTVTLTAETTVPQKDTTAKLSADTLWLEREQLENEFTNLFFFPEEYPHLTLSLKPTDHYQMVRIFTTGGSIFRNPTYRLPELIKRRPVISSEFVISPIYFDSKVIRNYAELAVYHLNDEYADIYVNHDEESDSWTEGNTSLVPEGISNVSNGGGLFTSFAVDTILFQIAAKK